jgi:hypothetical protein
VHEFKNSTLEIHSLFKCHLRYHLALDTQYEKIIKIEKKLYNSELTFFRMKSNKKCCIIELAYCKLADCSSNIFENIIE